jgi:hypothetical protein
LDERSDIVMELEKFPEWHLVAEVIRIGEMENKGRNEAWYRSGNMFGLLLSRVQHERLLQPDFDTCLTELDLFLRRAEGVKEEIVAGWLNIVFPWWVRVVPPQFQNAFIHGLAFIRTISHEKSDSLGSKQRTRRKKKERART